MKFADVTTCIQNTKILLLHSIRKRTGEQELQPREHVVDRGQIHAVQQQGAGARRGPHAKLLGHHVLSATQIKHNVIQHKNLVQNKPTLPRQLRKT